MAKQKQEDQLEPTYISSVRIRDETLRTCQKMNNREEWRERVRDTVLMARQDGDDEFPDL